MGGRDGGDTRRAVGGGSTGEGRAARVASGARTAIIPCDVGRGSLRALATCGRRKRRRLGRRRATTLGAAAVCCACGYRGTPRGTTSAASPVAPRARVRRALAAGRARAPPRAHAVVGHAVSHGARAVRRPPAAGILVRPSPQDPLLPDALLSLFGGRGGAGGSCPPPPPPRPSHTRRGATARSPVRTRRRLRVGALGHKGVFMQDADAVGGGDGHDRRAAGDDEAELPLHPRRLVRVGLVCGGNDTARGVGTGGATGGGNRRTPSKATHEARGGRRGYGSKRHAAHEKRDVKARPSQQPHANARTAARPAAEQQSGRPGSADQPPVPRHTDAGRRAGRGPRARPRSRQRAPTPPTMVCSSRRTQSRGGLPPTPAVELPVAAVAHPPHTPTTRCSRHVPRSSSTVSSSTKLTSGSQPLRMPRTATPAHRRRRRRRRRRRQ